MVASLPARHMIDFQRPLSTLQLIATVLLTCIVCVWASRPLIGHPPLFMMVMFPGILLISQTKRINVFDVLRCYLGGGSGAFYGYCVGWPMEVEKVFIYAIFGWGIAAIANLAIRTRRRVNVSSASDPDST